MIHPLIEELVHLGVEVSLSFREGKIFYNLNTGMKSECLVRFAEDGYGTVEVLTRYDAPRKEIVLGMDDLISLVRKCLYGREFYNPQWGAVFLKYDWTLPNET